MLLGRSESLSESLLIRVLQHLCAPARFWMCVWMEYGVPVYSTEFLSLAIPPGDLGFSPAQPRREGGDIASSHYTIW